jgi:hypothetical protein
LWHRVSVAQIDLLVAALDLSLVRLIRGAMADNAGGIPGPLGTIQRSPDLFESRHRVHPEPVIEPRKRIEPEPRFEPRTVYYTTRYQPLDPPAAPPCDPEPPDCIRPLPAPVQPPWRQLVWEQPIVVQRPVIKKIIVQPDVIHKGSLIDFFV